MFFGIKLDNLDYSFWQGKNSQKQIYVYMLSTCAFCQEVKDGLQALECSYYYIYIDYFDAEVLRKITKELEKNTKKNIGMPVIRIKDNTQDKAQDKVQDKYYYDFELEQLESIINNE